MDVFCWLCLKSLFLRAEGSNCIPSGSVFLERAAEAATRSRVIDSGARQSILPRMRWGGDRLLY